MIQGIVCMNPSGKSRSGIIGKELAMRLLEGEQEWGRRISPDSLQQYWRGKWADERICCGRIGCVCEPIFFCICTSGFGCG